MEKGIIQSYDYVKMMFMFLHIAHIHLGWHYQSVCNTIVFLPQDQFKEKP